LCPPPRSTLFPYTTLFRSFPSSPGNVFPLYHVFSDVAGWKDGLLLETHSNDEGTVTALALQTDDGVHVLLANLSPRAQSIELGPDRKSTRLNSSHDQISYA